MDRRRLAVVAGLAVVECWIVALMIRSIGGVGHAAYSASSAGQPSQTLETGPAPHVVIVADDAELAVSARPGTAVEVGQEHHQRGWFHGRFRPVTVEKTSDGVRIVRSDGGLSVTFGAIRERLTVVVPPDARLDVQNAGSMRISGLRAELALHSDDGTIYVADQRGNISAKTDNGRIELRDVEAASVDIGSDNGRVVCEGLRADRVAIATDSGRVEVSQSVLRGGTIQTDSGRIRLALDPRSDVTVTARAAAGKVVAESPLTLSGGGRGDAETASTIRLGSGAGRLDVGSDEGSITVREGG
jgi:hypothetical protein